MEQLLLRDPNILPDETLLKSILGNSFEVYKIMFERIAGVGLIPQWNYYKDGKAWLCKVQFKKKTVFWFSVWDLYFKVGFYFTEKHFPAFQDLDIDSSIKDQLAGAKPFGKLYPLTFTVKDDSQLEDIFKVIEFKKKL